MGITFKYIEDNLVEALEMFGTNERNVGLGGLLSAIAEFLGRAYRDPESEDGRESFKVFINRYLRPLDERYLKYADLLYDDLRNGSAHSVMPKGGVSLSYHPNSAALHLELINRGGRGLYQLFLYSPKLIAHWKDAMKKFVEEARSSSDSDLSAKYARTLEVLREASQEHIRNRVSSEELRRARIIDVQGTIRY